MYLQYGKPDQRVMQPSEPYSYPYEIWQWYRVMDKTNGMFYTNKKAVFVKAVCFLKSKKEREAQSQPLRASHCAKLNLDHSRLGPASAVAQ